MMNGVQAPYPMARKLRRFKISDHMLVALFEAGQVWGIKEGLPEGSRAVGLQLDKDLNCVVVYVEHPSFPYIDDCRPIPDARISFSDVTDDIREWRENA